VTFVLSSDRIVVRLLVDLAATQSATINLDRRLIQFLSVQFKFWDHVINASVLRARDLQHLFLISLKNKYCKSRALETMLPYSVP